jgi:Beta-lactamase
VAGCVAVAFLATGTSVGAAAPAEPDPAAIDRHLADSLEATRIRGMAAAIIRGGEVVHAAGYGTDGRGHPVTPRTPFRIGSLTKSFTTAAVLQLAAAGQDLQTRRAEQCIDLAARLRRLVRPSPGARNPPDSVRQCTGDPCRYAVPGASVHHADCPMTESLGLRPLDVGGLKMAHWLEGMGLVTVGLAGNGVGHWDFALGANEFTS